MGAGYSGMANGPVSFSGSRFILTLRPTRISPFQHRNRCSCNLIPGNASAAEATSKQEGLQLIRSPPLVAKEYADLNLTDKCSEHLGHVRIRQHVNPLRSSLMVPAEVPDWNMIYKDAALPLMVDIGCGNGTNSLLFMSNLLVIFSGQLVDRAKYWVDELALSNIHFIFANATMSFNQLVSTYPGPLMLVSILCPDPHFKRKYHKRRVVQKPLVESIINNLMPGGQVFSKPWLCGHVI